MKQILVFLTALSVISCSTKTEPEKPENTPEKAEIPQKKEVTPDLSALLAELKNDVKDVSRLMPHVRFVISPDCAYLMMMESDKPFFEEEDFRINYPKIFTKEVIDQLQKVTVEDLEIKKDEKGLLIGFLVSLHFSEYVKETGENEEWSLILQFVIEEETYRLICMQGAG